MSRDQARSSAAGEAKPLGGAAVIAGGMAAWWGLLVVLIAPNWLEQLVR